MQVPRNVVWMFRAKILFIAAGSTAAFLTAVSVLMLVRELHESRTSSECRFDLATEVNRADDAIDTLSAQIIEAAVQEDRVRVSELGRQLPILIEEQKQASERRAQATEVCNGG